MNFESSYKKTELASADIVNLGRRARQVVLSNEIATPMHLGARISIINTDITCHGYFWEGGKKEERHFAWPEEDIIEM